MTADIDCVWQELKEEDGVSFANAYSFCSKACMPDSGMKLKAKRELVNALYQRPLFDIDSWQVEIVPLKSKSLDNQESDLLPTLREVDLGCGIDESCASACGDSDDEEDEEYTPSSDASERTTIARLVGRLRSDEASQRIAALIQLKQVIGTLSKQCSDAPKLNFLPSFEQTLLEKELPLVSDLAKSVKRNECAELTVRSCVEPSQENSPDDAARVQLQPIMDSCGKSLFQLIGDKSEKCRVLSLECLNKFFLCGIDLGKHFPYLIPALVARYSRSAYDQDLEIFVADNDLHEFFKRGGAVVRQDRDGLLSLSSSFQLVEPNEELRLQLCQTFESLIRGAAAKNALPLLDSYFPDIILILQTSIKDPYSEVKVAACHLLVQLLRVPRWEAGAKHFATGLARATLPNLRHRKTNVIVAAIDLFEASVTVPNRAKRKGAGSSAISDLVGFQEENILSIAAFYDSSCGVSVNTLAELASHKNPRVRARCCEMLSSFLLFLPDRYDHQQRLLPYTLSLINDESPMIQHAALECIEKCGFQYEQEHPDDVVERIQLGVDGDHLTDYDDELPEPFTGRPSLGARLFVRSNTCRFYLAVLGELSNWKGQTRKRSADLLLIMAVYCEEHLTKDFRHIINAASKAIELESNDEIDSAYLNALDSIKKVVCLMSKYIDPASYFPLLAPRISGDGASATSYAEDGAHSEKTRHSHLIILSSLIQGAPLHRLIPYWYKIMSVLATNSCIGPFSGSKVQDAAFVALSVLIERVSKVHGDMNQLVRYLNESDESGNASQAVATLKLCRESLLQNEVVATNECSSKISQLVSFIEQN